MFPIIPQATSITYLAEGAANIVYTLGKPISHEFVEGSTSDHNSYGPGTPLPTELEIWETDVPQEDFSFLDGKLLRLRKDLPTVTSVQDAQKDHEQSVAPLFDRENLVEQSLIEMPGELISQLNSVLVAMEDGGYRSKKRHGVYLKDENYGMLVTDMSPHSGRHLVTVELKPKWLAQSPSAPEGAKRCRTCALRAMREVDTLAAHDSSSKDAFCPLNLVSNERPKVATAVKAIVHGRSDITTITGDVEKRFVDYLLTTNLLHDLRDLQLKLDRKGAFQADANNKDLLTAMTLRDCTLFLRVSSKAHPLQEG